MTDVKYKLHYFNLRSRVECARYLFHYAGVEFEDYRIKPEDYLSRDPSIPFDLYAKRSGQLPALEITENGETWLLSQSTTILRFLADRFDLAGKTDKERAECSEIIDMLQEPVNPAITAYYTFDDDLRKKAEKQCLEKDLPRSWRFLEKKLNQNGGMHMVGNDWTLADFAVNWVLGWLKDYYPGTASVIDQNFPGLVKLAKSVEEIPKIADYIENRPETPM